MGVGREATDGVFYHDHDYASLGVRLLILLIDGVVLFVVLVIALTTIGVAAPHLSFLARAALSVVLIFGYLAFLGRTSAGTLGYALTSSRIVDLRGEQPSVSRMLFRTLFVILGPLDALFNIVWLGGDAYRQSVYDKLAGTYVVRRGAAPAGHGRQHYVTYTLFGYTFMVREVRRDVT